MIAAWTYLYISMGFASWRVWNIGGSKAKIPLLIYIIKLVFNWAWLLIAFGFDWLLGAIIDTVTLLALIVLTCFLFYKIDKVAGFLFIPYFIYLSYVLVLCSHLYIINNWSWLKKVLKEKKFCLFKWFWFENFSGWSNWAKLKLIFGYHCIRFQQSGKVIINNISNRFMSNVDQHWRSCPRFHATKLFDYRRPSRTQWQDIQVTSVYNFHIKFILKVYRHEKLLFC